MGGETGVGTPWSACGASSTVRAPYGDMAVRSPAPRSIIRDARASDVDPYHHQKFLRSEGLMWSEAPSFRRSLGDHQFSFWVFGMRRCGLARVGEIEALLSRAGAVEA